MIDIIKFNPILLTLDILGKINAFVQVGAHDGEMFDPLRHFILKDNWNGILIEPQEDFFNKCIQGYKHLNNLIFVNAAVYKRRENIRGSATKNRRTMAAKTIYYGRKTDIVYNQNGYSIHPKRI